MTNKLKVTQVTIKDVLGIKEAGVEPGKITVFEGANASGKTAHLEAIKNTLGGGNLANLARIPDDSEDEIKPEVVLVIEGDEPGDYFRVEKTEKGVRVRKRVGDTAGLEDVPKPQRWLSGLIDPKLMNPIDFLNASEKERVLLLLEALPIEFNSDDLWTAMGLDKKDFGPIPAGQEPLTEISLIREAVFRERTGVNRDAKMSSQSAEKTFRTIPAVIPEGLEERIEELNEDVNTMDKDLTRKMVTIKSDCEARAQEIRNEHQEYAARLRAGVEAKIARHKEIALHDIAKSDNEKDTALEGLFEEQREVENKKRELQDLRNQQKNNIRFVTLKEQADKCQQDAEELENKSAELTQALKTLDSFRRGLLNNVPIDGLDVEDNTIKINGIPFDQINTANQIDVAVQIACLRAKKQPLPILFVDGAEALDSNNFKLFCEKLKQHDVWPFVGRVSDKPFDVRTEQ